MRQSTNDGSPVELELISGELLFVDPLYYQKIKTDKSKIANWSKEDMLGFIKNLEEKIFPYGGGTLLGYKKVSHEDGLFRFDISAVQPFDEDDIELESLAVAKEITAFSTDSGTFLILDISNFDRMLDCISYDELIDATLEGELEAYFHLMNARIGNQGWAFVRSPGVNGDFHFQGSGSFILNP